MEGWKRLFVVIAVGTFLISAAIWILDKPKDSHYAFGCADPVYVGRAEAARLLESRGFTQEQYSGTACSATLNAIANGERMSAEMQKWYSSLRYGILGISVFLAIVYAIGRAIGWIWRGFFPKKQPA